MSQPGPGAMPGPQYLLEPECRLSASQLWKLQHIFYQQQGAKAWSSNTVPEYISTNPSLARSYAQVVLGYLRDCLSGGWDPAQPVYIIELGAGSGRFAFYFLKTLTGLLSRLPALPVRICYVMTDFAESNLDAWRAHPALQPWLQSGQLDFARFNAAQDRELWLESAQRSLAPGTLTNPLVVIANYVLDNLPQDAFAIRGGELQECLVRVTAPLPQPDLSDPDLLGSIQVTYNESPATARPFDDSALDDILLDYAQGLPDTTLLFPTTAFDCLRRLAALASGRMLLIAGDKGYSRTVDIIRQEYPHIFIHGAATMQVNFHALGQFVTNQGGRFLSLGHSSPVFHVCAFLLGQHPSGWAECCLAYDQAVRGSSPEDFYSIYQLLQPVYDNLTIDQILAYLRMSGADPWLFQRCYAAIIAHLSGAPRVQQEDLAQLMEQVWENQFLPDPGDEDLPFALGSLFSALRRPEQALPLFFSSLEQSGPHPSTYARIAGCYIETGQRDVARDYLQRALALDPEHASARMQLARLDGQLPAPFMHLFGSVDPGRE